MKHTMNYNQEVSDYISRATADQIEMLEALRSLIHQSVEGTSEAIKWGMPVFRKNKNFTYLRFSAKHITLGFYNFERIMDTDKILEGEGNSMRHVKIRTMDDLKKETFSKWLQDTAD